MNKLLIVIDAQNDFITGSLGNKDAVKTVPTIVDIVKYAKENFLFSTVFTQDTHFGNYITTQEGTKLPVEHCIYLSKGWNIRSEIIAAAELRYVRFEKSSFGMADWKSCISKAFYDKITPDEIIICGFCTDICVIANFQIIKACYPEIPITIISDGCAGTSQELHNAALKVMSNCQANVTTWDEWKAGVM